MKSKTHMLATDLDGTLVGDEEELRNLIDYYDKLPYNVSLVYITGRHLESAKTLMREENLPTPDILVCDVGSNIYIAPEFIKDEKWNNKVGLSNWQPEKIIERASEFPSLKRQQLPNESRISFTAAAASHEVEALESALLEYHIPHKMIVSSNRDVDILPQHCGKGEALEYIIQNYAHCDVQVLIAGDSGNDLEMLELPYPSVVVGNAQKELDDLTKADGLLYRAQKKCAGGIFEAWQHYYETV